MKKSKAVILSYSPEPERICAAAARISTTQGTATDIYQRTDRSNIGDLIPKVLSSGHKTIIEHASFTIAFEDVSAFAEEFIIEFRLASYTVKSRRYVNYAKMGACIPEFRFKRAVSDDVKGEIQREYADHVDMLFSHYNFLIDNGIPKEDARFILPYGFRSNIYCTLNARELLHIIETAINGRGARFAEIKNLGLSLLSQAKNILPDVFGTLKENMSSGYDRETLLKKAIAGSTPKRVTGELTELIGSTEHSERLVAMTAITGSCGCSSDDALEMMEHKPDLMSQVLEIVAKDPRQREFEQANFTFRINGLSLSGLTHLVRHRIQSIHVPSFTECGKSEELIIPETIRQQPEILSAYLETAEKNRDVFEQFKTAGVVSEDLVYLYLSGNLMDVITTMNARQLYHFLRLRTCNRAQWEIRDIAVDMLMKLRKRTPALFMAAGPGCFMDGKCPEGKMTCGRMEEVKTFFKEKI